MLDRVHQTVAAQCGFSLAWLFVRNLNLRAHPDLLIDQSPEVGPSSCFNLLCGWCMWRLSLRDASPCALHLRAFS